MKRPLSPRSSSDDFRESGANMRKKTKLGLGISLLLSFVFGGLTKQSSSASSDHTTFSQSSPTLSPPPPHLEPTLGRQSLAVLRTDSIPRSSVAAVGQYSEGPLPTYSNLYESIKTSRNDKIIGNSERRLSCVHGDFVTTAGASLPLAYDAQSLLEIDENVSGSSTIGRITPQPNVPSFSYADHHNDVSANVQDTTRPHLNDAGDHLLDYPDPYRSNLSSYPEEGNFFLAADECDTYAVDDDGNLIRPPIISLNPRERYNLLLLKKAIESAELEQQKSKYMVDPHETRSIRLSNSTTIDTSTQTHDLDYLRRNITGKRHVSATRPTSALKRSKPQRRRGFSPGNFLYDKAEAPKPKAAPEPLDGYLGTIGVPTFLQRPSSPHKLGLGGNAVQSKRNRPQQSVRGKINLNLDPDYLAKSLVGIRLKPLASTEVTPSTSALPSGAFMFGMKDRSLAASQRTTLTDEPVSTLDGSPAVSAKSELSVGQNNTEEDKTAYSGKTPLLIELKEPETANPASVSSDNKVPIFSTAPSQIQDKSTSNLFSSSSQTSKPEDTLFAPQSDHLALEPKRKRRALGVNGDCHAKPLFLPVLSQPMTAQDAPRKPLFSFGNVQLSADNAKLLSASHKPVEPSHSLGEVGEINESPKPTFSFGQVSGIGKKDTPLFGAVAEKEIDANLPVRTLNETDFKATDSATVNLTQGNTAASSHSESNNSPSLRSGDMNSKRITAPPSSEKSGVESKEKPAFSFGASQAKLGGDKLAFSFGNSQVKPGNDRPAFTFGASQTKSGDDKPAFSFGDQKTKPSAVKTAFSFGGSQAKSNGTEAEVLDATQSPETSTNAASTTGPASNFGGSGAPPSENAPAKKNQTQPAASAFSFTPKPIESIGNDQPKKQFSFSFGAPSSDNAIPNEPGKPTVLFGAAAAATKPQTPDNGNLSSNSLFAQTNKSSINFATPGASSAPLGQATNSAPKGQTPISLGGPVFGGCAQQPTANLTGNGNSQNSPFQFAAGIMPSNSPGSLSAPTNRAAQPHSATPSFNFANAAVDPASIFGQAQPATGPGAFTFGSTAPATGSNQAFNFGGASAPAKVFGAPSAGPVTTFGQPANSFGGQSSAPVNGSGAPMNTFGTPATGFGGPANNTAPGFAFGGPNGTPGGMANSGMIMPQPAQHSAGLFGANAPPAPFAFNGGGAAPGMQPAFPGQVTAPPTGRRLAIPRRRR